MTIIQTIIFEFKTFLLNIFILHVTPQKNFETEYALNKYTKSTKLKIFQSKIIYRYVSSCSALSI